MKINKLLLTIFFLFFFKCIIAQPCNSTDSDSLDERKKLVKKYLITTLPEDEFLSLHFESAVVSKIDFLGDKSGSLDYYLKVPYKNTDRKGFLLVRKKRNDIQYVQVDIENYQYRDTLLNQLKTVTKISNTVNKSYQIFITDYRGMITDAHFTPDKEHLPDSVFKKVPLFGNLFPVGHEKTYINGSLIFNDMVSLNKEAMETSVIIHQFIPLSFSCNSSETLDVEFSN